eukprot:TRINITY_DN24135_c0_g1_i1.p1 TRINITY_DN24135_c0_g1~~TRINITY_DN24135_c0_g1_i1.p1  ORF type:complete len:211 (-),score=52.58 TRINITY_DN24135_c0_g1_i1:59-691(-)
MAASVAKSEPGNDAEKGTLLNVDATQEMVTGDSKQKIQEIVNNTEKGYSLLQIIFGITMIIIGVKYGDPCPNGAAFFLYVGGICLLLTNILNILSKLFLVQAVKDGKITSFETCGIWLLLAASGAMVIVDLVILIWGSVVVFGAWSSWTDDYDEYAAQPEIFNYCAYTPMVFAFVILLLKWILIPLMFVIVFCCGCLGACCCCLCLALSD